MSYTDTTFSDRVLHMSDRCREEFEKTRLFAVKEGILNQFLDAYNYMRTFSLGPERDWKSELSLDMPHHSGSHMYICTIYRRVPREEAEYGDEVGGLKHYMTIGMVYRPEEKNWSFHS